MLVTVGSMISLHVAGVPEGFIGEMVRSVTFRNPEFDRLRAIGRPTTGIERELVCCSWAAGPILRVPRGCLDTVTKLARVYGIEISLANQTLALDPPIIRTEDLVLRPYQREAADAMYNRQQGVISMPCGSGKTVTAIGAMTMIDQPTLVLVHTKHLLSQWMDEIWWFTDKTPGQIGGGVFAPRPITVATVQSLTSDRIDSIAQMFGCIFIDECHHAPAATWSAILRRMPARWIIGLSATPEREDGLTRIMLWDIGPILYEARADDLCKKGFLERTRVIRVPTEFEFNYQRPAFWTKMTAAMCGDRPRTQLAVDIALAEVRRGRTVAVLSGRVEHCKRMASMISGAGAPAEAVYSKIGVRKRTRIMAELRSGQLPVVCATQLFDEGVDVPRLGAVVKVYPGRGRGKAKQQQGRLMRPSSFKDGAGVLYDLVDQHVWRDTENGVGYPLVWQWYRRKSAYRQDGADVREDVPLEEILC